MEITWRLLVCVLLRIEKLEKALIALLPFGALESLRKCPCENCEPDHESGVAEPNDGNKNIEAIH